MDPSQGNQPGHPQGGQPQANQPGQSVHGPAGRRIHVAHRRSPSELTPLMMEQLALQQQIELLQHQQQQIAAHQQYMGLLQPQPPLQNLQAFSPLQGQSSVSGLSPGNSFQFAQLQTPQQHPIGPAQSSHRRNQSALPNLGIGPPPAPSSGTSASPYADLGALGQGQGIGHVRENGSIGGGRGRGPPGGGHQRRHSLALPEARKAAEIAEKKRTASNFQFPAAGSSYDTQPEPTAEEKSRAVPSLQGLGLHAGNIRAGGHMRSQSMAVGTGRRGAGGFQFPQSPEPTQDTRRSNVPVGHGRSASRNFDLNWRQQSNQSQMHEVQNSPMGSLGQQTSFQPGHRARGSLSQSISSINPLPPFQGQQLLQLPQGGLVVTPAGMFAGQQVAPLQLAQLQALQQGGQLNGQNLGIPNAAVSSQLSSQQQQQQRKTLFTPYLPQANLPALLTNGQLVAGILRVNKKNRSDAYVTTNDLDADIFICGSKDRNRALEGDYVAVELLDVDEVWNQKREKEEKKKRKDITDSRVGSSSTLDKNSRSDSVGGEPQIAPDGSIRRRGSLRQRPMQKKNDDVEVEGQSLLLVEEDEISDEQKPLYAGHIVAVIERFPGQMFSGSLGLLRPSSQATKEKQEAERARDGSHNRHHNERQDKPKIVWFKPTDKRVPLIAIPTEQAPRDFVERHQDYANNIFVACIKRWPITSLHPFGTLVEQLGPMGDLKVETDALLRDNNFGSDEFSEAVLKAVGFQGWSVAKETEEVLAVRRDFRSETAFTIDPNGSQELDDALHVKRLPNGKVEIGVHVTDIAHFVKANTIVDREAKKRGSGVYLMTRVVNMLPQRLANDLCSLLPGEDRLTVSVVFTVNPNNGEVEGEPWIGKSIIRSSGKLAYDEVESVISGGSDIELRGASVEQIKLLHEISVKFRIERFGHRSKHIPSLRLLYQLDDENVPVQPNVFNTAPAHVLIEELSHKANFFVARKLVEGLPQTAFLRRQEPPNFRRLQKFVDRMSRLGYNIDPTSSGTLQTSLFRLENDDIRKSMETVLLKSMRRAKYYIAGTVPESLQQHYVLNLPVYTHFTNPSRRYADIVVHRQLEAVLSNGQVEFTEDIENLSKTAEQCNNKKDSAQNAQEQSVHIESCRSIDKKKEELGEDLVSEGIVLCVYESAFDVLIPEYGFEKRVHCDQLPLKKAEFRNEERVLELYWEKGVSSSSYIPEDERPKPLSSRAVHAAAAAREAEAARQRAREREEAQRQGTETGTISTDDVDALFDDDEEDIEDLTDVTAGVSLNTPDRTTQSTPSSPARDGQSQQAPQRARSDSRVIPSASEVPESNLSTKDKYLQLFTLREQDGEYIQDVREMARVPVILRTDLTKSPPCLTIRSMNPYAL